MNTATIGADPDRAARVQHDAVQEPLLPPIAACRFACDGKQAIGCSHPVPPTPIFYHGTGKFFDDAVAYATSGDGGIAKSLDTAIRTDPDAAVTVFKYIAHDVVGESIGRADAFNSCARQPIYSFERTDPNTAIAMDDHARECIAGEPFAASKPPPGIAFARSNTLPVSRNP